MLIVKYDVTKGHKNFKIKLPSIFFYEHSLTFATRKTIFVVVVDFVWLFDFFSALALEPKGQELSRNVNKASLTRWQRERR